LTAGGYFERTTNLKCLLSLVPVLLFVAGALKSREWTSRHQVARVDIVGVDIAGVDNAGVDIAGVDIAGMIGSRKLSCSL